MTRTWLNTKFLDLTPWEWRCVIAVQVNERTLLYITEGGHIHIQNYDDEGIHMPSGWVLL